MHTTENHPTPMDRAYGVRGTSLGDAAGATLAPIIQEFAAHNPVFTIKLHEAVNWNDQVVVFFNLSDGTGQNFSCGSVELATGKICGEA